MLRHKTSLFFNIQVFLQKYGNPSRARSLLSRPAGWNELSIYQVDFALIVKSSFAAFHSDDKDSAEFMLLAMHSQINGSGSLLLDYFDLLQPVCK